MLFSAARIEIEVMWVVHLALGLVALASFRSWSKATHRSRIASFRCAKGDGSLDWSGPAGIARQRDQRLMSKDTPIFIASVTKLYTATAVMPLVEKGALSLDDPMAKYAARHCSDWAGRRLSWQDTFRPAGRDYRLRRARVECNPTVPQESNRLYGCSNQKPTITLESRQFQPLNPFSKRPLRAESDHPVSCS